MHVAAWLDSQRGGRAVRHPATTPAHAPAPAARARARAAADPARPAPRHPPLTDHATIEHVNKDYAQVFGVIVVPVLSAFK